MGTRLNYVPGSSYLIDGAVETMLSGAGVCRDFAHLVVALLRAVKIPARAVSVYAPGLYPMDFHAVAEAFVGGQWRVVDGTLLAPRQALVRIATCWRDAADIAFLDNHRAEITLTKLVVTAIVDDAFHRLIHQRCRSADGPIAPMLANRLQLVDGGEMTSFARRRPLGEMWPSTNSFSRPSTVGVA